MTFGQSHPIPSDHALLQTNRKNRGLASVVSCSTFTKLVQKYYKKTTCPRMHIVLQTTNNCGGKIMKIY